VKKLLSELEDGKVNTAYQSYTLRHGIETMQLLIPLAAAPLFEERFNGLNNKSKKQILALVEELGGKARG
jgi:hypothetical protein